MDSEMFDRQNGSNGAQEGVIRDTLQDLEAIETLGGALLRMYKAEGESPKDAYQHMWNDRTKDAEGFRARAMELREYTRFILTTQAVTPYRTFRHALVKIPGTVLAQSDEWNRIRKLRASELNSL